MVDLPPLGNVAWEHAHRIVRTIYPPIHLFEDIADPADWELLVRAEAKTNPRIRDHIGAIRLVPVERRVGGPGASIVMAPFTHTSPERPTRFSDGAYGVYYAGNCFAVALHETVHHIEAFMRRTNESAGRIDMRQYVGTIDAEMHDIRDDDRFADCLDPGDYGAAQALGRWLRGQQDSKGIVYRSVRYPAGEAIGAFWPDVVAIPVQAQHLCYRWDGTRINAYLVYGQDDWIELANQ